jgi:biopolymer transport protein ExbD
MSQINITPFVDVVLVLLVIFMVTAPMLVKDILDIRLPKVSSGSGSLSETLGVAINRNGNILLNGMIIDEEQLASKVRDSYKANPEVQAVISADVEVAYGKVATVIDIIKSNGIEKFAVQIEKKSR